MGMLSHFRKALYAFNLTIQIQLPPEYIDRDRKPPYSDHDRHQPFIPRMEEGQIEFKEKPKKTYAG